MAWERPNGLTDSPGQKFKHGTMKWEAFGPDVWELIRRSLRSKVRIFRNTFTPISGHDSSYQWGFLAWLSGYNLIRLLHLAWAMDKAWLPFKHEHPDRQRASLADKSYICLVTLQLKSQSITDDLFWLVQLKKS